MCLCLDCLNPDPSWLTRLGQSGWLHLVQLTLAASLGVAQDVLAVWCAAVAYRTPHHARVYPSLCMSPMAGTSQPW